MAKKYKIHELTDDVLEDLKAMRVSGKTMTEIAAYLGVTLRTLEMWRKKHPGLDEALNEAEAINTDRLGLAATEALIRKLATREVTEITFTEFKDADGVITKTKTDTKTKQIEPSDALVMFALQRVNPELWDKLAVKRLEQGAEDSDDYAELIDKILGKDGDA